VSYIVAGIIGAIIGGGGMGLAVRRTGLRYGTFNNSVHSKVINARPELRAAVRTMTIRLVLLGALAGAVVAVLLVAGTPD
jgi:hypothetical protein